MHSSQPQAQDGASYVGVVIAEDLPHPGDGVFEQPTGASIVAEGGSVYGEASGSAQGARVVIAEDPSAAGQDVLIQIASRLDLAQVAQNVA